MRAVDQCVGIEKEKFFVGFTHAAKYRTFEKNPTFLKRIAQGFWLFLRMRNVAVFAPLTALEVCENLPESTLAEVIDNKIYLSDSPVARHQSISLHLASQLFFFAKQNDAGSVFVAPFDVYLDEEKSLVQPDILFILKENEHIVRGHVHGSPDLIIEILSLASKKRDLVTKKPLYEKFAIKEYWIIDPETNTAFGFQLQKGVYVKLPPEKNKLTSPLLKNVFVF
ncbi:Uma2 family endonuclease [Chryseolinea soli]|uniref:Uma2 family endonuclease n=2 Tax=Chryseolinea soli TaxID=2321403 RepID=A0A385SYM0_9BACT|nr:Uma2 family endonuclease [Chryseolinea soli]